MFRNTGEETSYDAPYDAACYELAKAFLEDADESDKKRNTPVNRHLLTQEIQQTIEDFLHDLEG